MRKAWNDLKDFYGGLIFPRAWQDTCAALGWRPLKPVALMFPVLYLFAFLALAMYRGWNFAVDQVVAAAFLTLIPAMLILLGNLAIAPARLMKDHRRFARDSARLARLLPRLGLARLNPDQKLRFQKALEGIEPRPVTIFYLDTPTSGANAFTSDLVDAFQSALWHAGMRGEQEGYDVQGVMMKIEPISHIRPAQQAVLDAFRSIGVQVGYMPGHDVADRVELIVGEM